MIDTKFLEDLCKSITGRNLAQMREIAFARIREAIRKHDLEYDRLYSIEEMVSLSSKYHLIAGDWEMGEVDITEDVYPTEREQKMIDAWEGRTKKGKITVEINGRSGEIRSAPKRAIRARLVARSINEAFKDERTPSPAP